MTDTGEGGRPGDMPDLFGPVERSGVVRGWVVVLVAVVVGAILLPSATRASLPGSHGGGGQAAAATTTLPAQSTSTTTVPGTSTTLPAVSASSIKVLVANGTNTNGAATTVSSFLSGKGFSTLSPVNALTVVHASEVYAVADQLAAARQVVAALGLTDAAIEPASTPIPVSSVGPAVVVVIVGPDLLSRA